MNMLNESIGWSIYIVGLSMVGVEALIISLIFAILLSKNFSKI